MTAESSGQTEHAGGWHRGRRFGSGMRWLFVLVVCGLGLALLLGGQAFSDEWRGGELDSAFGVAAVQSTGEVVVVDQTASRVVVLSASGEFLRTFGWGVVDRQEKLEVCTAKCEQGLAGEGAGELGNGGEMTVTVDQATGDLYVYDGQHARIQEFTPAGEWLSMFGKKVNMTTGGDVCSKSEVEGGDQCQQGEAGTGPGQLEKLEYPIVYEPVSGQIWAASGNEIQVFTPEGVFVKQFVPAGLSDVKLLAPAGSGEFYAAEGEVSEHQEIYRFAPLGGTVVCTVADQYANHDPSVRHQAMVEDEAGELIVNDSGRVGAGPETSALVKFNKSCEETRQWDQHPIGEQEIRANALATGETLKKIYATGNVGGFGGQRYDFRIIDQPSSGPEVSPASCNPVSTSSLQVEASVNPEGKTTKYWFEYVSQKTFEEHGWVGAPKAGEGELLSDFGEHSVSTALQGLTVDTVYHVRASAENAEAPGGVTGAEVMCSTRPVAELSLLPVGEVSTSAVSLAGFVDPEGLATQVVVEYWPVGSSAVSQTEPVAVAAGSGYTLVSRKLSGLSAGTAYRYRLVATNSAGSIQSAEQSFTTAGGACANHALRRGASSALGECRAYELVTPPQKGGAPPGGLIATESTGDAVAFYTVLPMPSSASGGLGDYVSRRGSEGWQTTSIAPALSGRSTTGAKATDWPFIRLMSGDLSSALIETSYPLNPEAQGRIPLPAGGEGHYEQPRQVYLRQADGALGWLSAPPALPDLYPEDSEVVGATPDLSHVLISTVKPLVAAAKDSSEPNLYEWSEGQIELVNQETNGSVIGGGASAGGPGGPEIAQGIPGRPAIGEVDFPSAISSDGGTVYFTAAGGVLYARREGKTTEVSVSQRAGSIGTPSNAQFLAASSDGNQIAFYSNGQLTNDATPEGGIYQYSLQTSQLTFAGASGAVASREVVGATPNLSYVYFTIGNTPRNLYVLHEDKVTLIARLELHGAYGGEEEQASMSPSGQYLAFLTDVKIGGYENHDEGEIYEYNATTNSTACVSCNPTGIPPTAQGGPNWLTPSSTSGFRGVNGTRPQLHVVTNNGSVFFDSFESLLPQDTNHQEDVYEYSQGQLMLISTGTSGRPSAIAGISNEGQNVFFVTSETLTENDVDNGQADIYDARIQGGYPPVPHLQPCAEANCSTPQTPLTEPLQPPASSTLTTNGNTPPQTSKPTKGSKPHKHKPAKHQHKHAKPHKHRTTLSHKHTRH